MSRALCSVFFMLTGAAHFIWPETYLKMMPPGLPWPKAANLISGLAEIGFAIGLLFEPTRILCAWGLTLLLIAVFPVNIYMVNHPLWAFPQWIYIARLPLQIILIYWTWSQTRIA